jgi:serine/threonine protein kinase
VKDGSLLVEADTAPAEATSPAPPPVEAPGTNPATLTGQILDARYRIAQRLGEGGMSYVYQADDLETGRTVAVKILIPRLAREPASVERLRREATIATRLGHPNVCPILRMGETLEGLLYLVMPFLEGQPLSEHEMRHGPSSAEEGVSLLVQMCQGLQHAHELQIIHRDLKPENVMLVPQRPSRDDRPAYRAVVMDFGLAKERRASADVVKLTQTGIVLGTPEFMSPEQIRGKPLDGRSDIYALGVLAFELFTGQLPFTGKSAQETMIARLKGAPASLGQYRSDLPPKLEAVIARTLAASPDDRYSSMEELAYAFEDVVRPGVFGRLFRR